jgi:hypothetical protein
VSDALIIAGQSLLGGLVGYCTGWATEAWQDRQRTKKATP